jgi:colanic acid biosynthesis glycosyl transferase WcaI
MSRVIFLNRVFVPDHSATSQLLADVTTDLAASDYEVHVVTSQQLYDDPKVRLPGETEAARVMAPRVVDGNQLKRRSRLAPP